MAAITWSQVVLLASELSTLGTDAQDLILSYVNDESIIQPAVWGGVDSPKYTLGRIYLAAHLGTLAKPAAGGGAGIAGPVTQVSEGDVTVQFANLAAGSGSVSALDRTKYGTEYRRLGRTTSARVCGVP